MDFFKFYFIYLFIYLFIFFFWGGGVLGQARTVASISNT